MNLQISSKYSSENNLIMNFFLLCYSRWDRVDFINDYNWMFCWLSNESN